MIQDSIEMSLIIPAHSEHENLSWLLPRINRVISGLEIQCEVIVIDTVHALDKTEEICFINSVRCLRRSPTNSFGDALRTGICNAQGSYILTMDGDGSHEPELIPKLLENRSLYDVIIASRYCQDGATENSFILTLMSWILNQTYRIILGISCRDVSNSYRLYRGDLLRSVDLRCDNFDIVEEILVKMQRKAGRLRILEIPFVFRKRVNGVTKRNLLVFVISYIVTIIRLRTMD